MSNSKDTCQEKSENVCNNRREFLVKASAITGGLMLSLSSLGATAKAATVNPEDETVVVKLDDKSGLSKVGGSETIETKSGKVIVVRTGDMAFSAYSALCTHKGGPLKYDAAAKQLVCPWHASKFDAEGKPVGGPAKQPLATYGAQESVVVTITPKA